MAERIFCKKRFMRTVVWFGVITGFMIIVSSTISEYAHSDYNSKKCKQKLTYGWDCSEVELYSMIFIDVVKILLITTAIRIAVEVILIPIYNYYFPKKKNVRGKC